MDSLGETLENIGLSQEIQKGLAANLQKKPDFVCNMLSDSEARGGRARDDAAPGAC